MTPSEQHSAWTLATLHEYVLRLIDEKDRLYVEKFNAGEKAVSAAIAAADRATEKAEAATERRFEGVNEMRQMAVDNLRVTMPRLEQEQINKGLADKIDTIEKRLSMETGQKVGSKDTFAYLIAGAALLISAIEAVALIVHK